MPALVRRDSWAALAASGLARTVLIGMVTFMFWAVAPAALGWHPTVVSSASMLPRLQVGDVVVSRPVPTSDLSLGQILLVHDPDHADRLRMHRYVRTTADGNLVLRGDANRTDDSSPVAPSAVEGVGSLRIPMIARPVVWATEGNVPALAGFGIALAALFGLAFWFRADPDADPHGVRPFAPPRHRAPRAATRRAPHSRPRAVAVVVGVATTVVLGLVVAPHADAAPFGRTTTAPTSTWAANPYFTCGAVATNTGIGTPTFYFPLSEASGTAVADISGHNYPGTYQNTTGITYGTAGPCPRDNQTAVTLNGSTGYISTSTQVPAPQTYTESIWFRTTTTTGGMLLSFGSTSSGSTSASYGREIYMNNAGQVVSYVWNGNPQNLTSATAYNDGRWHMATAIGSTTSGTKLFVDGVQVGANASITSQDSYQGYWRIGYEGTWYSPTTPYFAGSVADAAVWPTVLTSTQIAGMYYAGTGSGTGTCAAAVTTAGSASFYYALGERSGTAIADTSGNNRNGTYYNTPTFKVAGPCPRDNLTAVTMNGTDDFLSGNGTVTPPQVLTQSVWFRTTSTTGGDLLGFGDAVTGGLSSNHNRQLSMVSGGRVNYHTDGAYNLISTKTYNDGAWHMATATMSSAGPRLYLDGTLVSSAAQPTSLVDFTGNWRIGDKTESGSTTNYLAGSFAQVVVYPVVLSADKILALYSAGT